MRYKALLWFIYTFVFHKKTVAFLAVCKLILKSSFRILVGSLFLFVFGKQFETMIGEYPTTMGQHPVCNTFMFL